jgi:predicted tellurium resistance membrane protein TerC
MELFSPENLFTLLMLIFLESVLGFDNLLYISIESKRAPKEDQASLRKIGVILAIAQRIILLFVIMKAIESFQDPIVSFHHEWFEGVINVHSLIVFLGGVFIIYTAIKELTHMLSFQEFGLGDEDTRPKTNTYGRSLAWIFVMNLVFSFDSILSAVALTDVFMVMAIAIVISGILMVVLAETVAEFLQKNRLYEVLGLFILFLVGVMLVGDGGHLAHLKFFGHAVEPMAKTTFYFTLVILVLVDVAQGRYQKKLQREAEGASARAQA